mgnify:CR=1 FL=1
MCLLMLGSCKKQIEEPALQEVLSVTKSNPPDLQKNSVQTWLEEQKSELTPIRNEAIQLLQENLDYESMHIEILQNGETATIVPVKSSYVSQYNKDRNPVNVMFIRRSENGDVIQGNIVQYIPANGPASSIPENTFSYLYENFTLEEDCELLYLSITDVYKYEFRYEGGNIATYKYRRSEPSKQFTGKGEGGKIMCYDQYLVTTSYYFDGHVEVTEEYLGTVCYGDCLPGEKCDELEGGGGGGGPQNPIEYRPVIAQSSWKVWSSGRVFVASFEKFTGMQNTRVFNDGYFTSVTHTMSDVVSLDDLWTWTETAQSSSFSGHRATVMISGIIKRGGMPNEQYAEVVTGKWHPFFFALLSWQP